MPTLTIRGASPNLQRLLAIAQRQGLLPDDEAPFEWRDDGPAPANRQNAKGTARKWVGYGPDKGVRYQIIPPGSRGKKSPATPATEKPKTAPTPKAKPTRPTPEAMADLLRSGTPPAPEALADSLNSMVVGDLKELAKILGVTKKGLRTKSPLVAEIQAAAKQLAGEKVAPPAPKVEPVVVPPSQARSFETLRDVANELQAIREDMASTDPDDDLKGRVDAAGAWLARNAKQTGMGADLLREASSLADRLEGGSGKGGTRIALPKPAPAAAVDDSNAIDLDQAPRLADEAETPDSFLVLPAEITNRIARELGTVDFWRNPVAQQKLRGWVVGQLDVRDLVDFDTVEITADAIMQRARDGEFDGIGDVPSEFRPKKPGFTGQTGPDALGRVYNWVDGKRVKRPDEPTTERPIGELETDGGSSPLGGLPEEQPLGADAGPTPETVLPGSGEGTGQGSGELPDRPDPERPDLLRGAGGSGDSSGPGEGAGDPGTAADPGGRAEPTPGLGDRGERGERPAGRLADAPERSLSEPATAENPTDLSAGNWRYTFAEDGSRNFAQGGPKAKFRDNLAAIKTLRGIQMEGRDSATPEEQAILSKFVGWGQFPGVFNEYSVDWNEQKAWTSERNQIRALMSDEEWAAAKKSTLNAHYTHPGVVKAHWEMAQRLGFNGGRFLETSAGVGYYLGLMPADLATQTRSSAVELDPTTGKILELLYPAANVKVQGFEEFKSPDNFYDLVASNVPFGDFGVHDPRYNKHNPRIHDYFFLKSLDKVRPGGLVMHVTSSGTMDKQDPEIRELLAGQAELVAAVRFPGGAHQENAGTAVVTDLLILRKKHPDEGAEDLTVTPDAAQPKKPGFTGQTVDSLGRVYHWVDGKRVPGPRWDDVVMVPDPAGGDPIPVNRYFAEHPEQVLGTLDRTGTMYHGESVNVSKTEDYEQRLQAAIARLPEGVLQEASAPTEAFSPDVQVAPGDVKEYAYVVKDGKLYTSESGALVEVKADKKLIERIQAHQVVRDAARAVINAQLRGEDATDARAALNTTYDAFVKKWGPLHAQANRRAFRTDPDAPILLALEKYDAESKTAQKADIFVKDTVRPFNSQRTASTPAEALVVSLHETGGVNVGRMAELLGKTPEEIGRALVAQGLAFEDPGQGWTPADIYLSGNVRQKLTLARAAAEADPKYAANVNALMGVQPEDIDYTGIDVKLGAAWVPSSDVKQFCAEMLGGRPGDFVINYIPVLGQWQADFVGGQSGKWVAQRSRNSEWITARAGFDDILQAALSGTTITITDPDPTEEGKRIVNRQATDDANAKVQELKDRFKEWVWEDDARRDRLHRYYNDNFNNIRHLKYDGSHQTFPGMNPSIELRDHQKNFVWQVVTTGKGLAAHEVGTGKAGSLDSLLLTPTGWVRMGDIRVGDMVIAGDGTPTVVEGVFPQGEKDMFRVTFSDGGSTECCDEHLWLTQTYKERNHAAQARMVGKNPSAWPCATPKVRSLAEIRETIAAPHLNARNHSIPLVGSVQFDARDVPIDPYLLGVLLGDGCLRQGTPSVSKPDVELKEMCRELVPAGVAIHDVSIQHDRCPRWSLVREERKGFGALQEANPVTRALEELGLMGLYSYEKFIPDDYLFNTPDVRLATLQGLLDTDGWVDNNGHSVCYSSASSALADDVVFLVRSFGGTVKRILKKEPKCTHQGEKRTGRPFHILHISLPPDVPPFRLNRKADLVVPKTKYRPARYIVSVEPVGKKEAQCIRVAHPSHLYVTDDLIVTHNTLSMIASAMELRRLGLAKKPAIACLKANIEQITASAQDAYPGAKIISTADMFDAASRQKTIARIATGDYDMVILTHDHLDLLQMKPEVVQGYIREELAELESAIVRAMADDMSSGNKVVKALERSKEKLKVHLKKSLDASDKDDAVYFEETGIDHIFVDEAQQFKNLAVSTKRQNIKGIPQGGSDRATDMHMRARWLQENNGGRGVVFATGTPIMNAMSEMYNLQRYLQPEELKQRGIDHFDAWANVFGDIETKNEFTVAGEYKPVSRFVRFTNVTDLMGLAGQMMDVQRGDMMVNPDGTPTLVRPKRVDEAITSPNSEGMQQFMASLQARAKALSGKRGKPEKGSDNMLVVCTDGRKGAIDLRLIDPEAEDDPQSKANQVVRKVLAIHQENPGVTQLIFSDIGVNPIKVEGQGSFYLYGDIIDKLVRGGIPREKIADFSKLEGAKKEAVMEAMKRGEILVGIGGTSKLGTGVNVQDKLRALHHLDVPQRPGDIEQRDGRGWRQGNRNDPSKPATEQQVDIYRYIAEGSLDSRFWQVISTKAKMIKQVVNSPDQVGRVVKEEDTEELSPEELMAIATGDPNVMEKVNIDEEVKNLTRARDRHEREQWKFKTAAKSARNLLPTLDSRAAKTRRDADHLEANKDFSFSWDGQHFTDRKQANEYFDAWRKDPDNSRRVIGAYGSRMGSYRGMDLTVHQGMFRLHGPSGETYDVNDSIQSIEAITRNIPKRAADAEATAQASRADVTRLESQIGKTFAKAEELAQKQARSKELDALLSSKNDQQQTAFSPTFALEWPPQQVQKPTLRITGDERTLALLADACQRCGLSCRECSEEDAYFAEDEPDEFLDLGGEEEGDPDEPGEPGEPEVSEPREWQDTPDDSEPDTPIPAHLAEAFSALEPLASSDSLPSAEVESLVGGRVVAEELVDAGLLEAHLTREGLSYSLSEAGKEVFDVSVGDIDEAALAGVDNANADFASAAIRQTAPALTLRGDAGAVRRCRVAAHLLGLGCRKKGEATFGWRENGPAPASQQNKAGTKKRWTGTPPDKGTRYQISEPHTRRGKRGAAKPEKEKGAAPPVSTAPTPAPSPAPTKDTRDAKTLATESAMNRVVDEFGTTTGYEAEEAYRTYYLQDLEKLRAVSEPTPEPEPEQITAPDKKTSALIAPAAGPPALSREDAAIRKRLLQAEEYSSWGLDAKDLLRETPPGSSRHAILGALAKEPKDGLSWAVLADAIEDEGAAPDDDLLLTARVRSQLLSEASPEFWENARLKTVARLKREMAQGMDDLDWANSHPPGERDDQIRGLIRQVFENDKALPGRLWMPSIDIPVVFDTVRKQVPSIDRQEFKRIIDEWSPLGGLYDAEGHGVRPDGALGRTSSTHDTHYTNSTGQYHVYRDLVDYYDAYAIDRLIMNDAPLPPRTEAGKAVLAGMSTNRYIDVDELQADLNALSTHEVERVGRGVGMHWFEGTKAQVINRIMDRYGPFAG